MSVFWKKIEFYKGKNDRKAIVFATWDLKQSPVRLLRAKRSKQFWFFNIFKAIKPLTMAFKKLYSWPKKL